MKRNSRMRGISGLLALALGLSLLMSGCRAQSSESGAAGSEAAAKEETTAVTAASEGENAVLPDGVYTARFETDSSMFHVSEAMHDRGTLTVKDGKMTLHVSLQSKRILNLFPGRTEDAKKDGAVLLQPTTDTVKFEDGSTQEVYGFDIPVPALDTEFPLALVGTKGVWYDHQVKVTEVKAEEVSQAAAPEIPGLRFVKRMDLRYAKTFDIYFYEKNFALIDVHGAARYLVIPEGETAPKELPGDVVRLQQPLDHIYLAATAAMSLFEVNGALGDVRFTGTRAEGWHIDAPKQALSSGAMRFAGKYSAPDYELLTSEGCDLAVESLMILHAPEVKEMFERLGIPVFVDYSSNESHPLGRTEWVRLYGVLTNHQAEAERFFDAQCEKMDSLRNVADSGKQVVFFAMNRDGSFVVRRRTDYVPKMIQLAGGHYVGVGADETGRSSVQRVSREAFFEAARDADVLIYNATVEAPLKDLAELKAKDELFADFKAVQAGEVYQLGGDMYQSADAVAGLTLDFYRVLHGETDVPLQYLRKLS